MFGPANFLASANEAADISIYIFLYIADHQYFYSLHSVYKLDKLTGITVTCCSPEELDRE